MKNEKEEEEDEEEKKKKKKKGKRKKELSFFRCSLCSLVRLTQARFS